MKRTILVMAACATTLVGVYPALAVNMQNRDDRDYEVSIEPGDDGQARSTFILFSGATEEDVCDACTIIIEDVGEIDAEGRQTVEIAGGKMSKK